MSNERDGDTRQLIAEAEALTGKGAADGGGSSTREIVSSAEKLLNKSSEPPKLSPVPLMIIIGLVIIASLIGIWSSGF